MTLLLIVLLVPLAQAGVAYEFDVIAKTGTNTAAGTLGDIGNGPSINDDGVMAFIGQVPSGGTPFEGLFIGNGGGNAPQWVSSGFTSSVKVFSSAVQINNALLVVSRDRDPGSPPFTFLRRWDGPGSFEKVGRSPNTGFPNSPYDSVLAFPSVNNTGDVVFLALPATHHDPGDVLKLVYANGGDIPTLDSLTSCSSYLGLVKEATLPFQGGISPMLADNGKIVAMVDDGTGSNAEIRLYDPSKSVSILQACAGFPEAVNDFTNVYTTIASVAGGDFSQLGRKPGIADDGNAIAFFGTDSTGSVIRLKVLKLGGDPSVPSDWQLIQVAGLVDKLGPGLQLQNFRIDARVGVNGKRSPVFGRASVYYVTFIAQNPATGQDSLWQRRVLLRAELPSPPSSKSDFTTVVLGDLEKVAEIGETLTLADDSTTPSITALDIYDPINKSGDITFWAQFGADTAVVRAKQEPPLVVNIVTHGFKPFGSWDAFRKPYYDLANTLDNIPTPGKLLDGRVRSYVSEWESAEGFAFFTLLYGIISEQAGVNALAEGHPIQATVLIARSLAFKEIAQFAAKTSAKRAEDAANTIFKDVTEQLLLSDPAESAAFPQIVHLVGHSRGGAVNARVSKLLSDAGYTVDQYTALDGFSTDWPDDGSLIGDISIVGEATAGRKVNYRVQKDLAGILLDCVEGTADPGALDRCDTIIKFTATKLAITDAAVSLLFNLNQGTRDLVRSLNIKAPNRSGFDNKCMHFSGVATDTGGGECLLEGVYGSHHLNITDLYTQSDKEIIDNYVGKHKGDPKVLSSTISSTKEVWRKPAETQKTHLTAALDEVSGDFIDGGFESLGAFLAEAQNADQTPTGVQIVDQWFQLLSKPQEILSSLWTISGDVQLVTEGGNTLVELSQTSNTSLGQLLLLKSGAKSLDFDFSPISSGPGDELQVYFNGQLLASLPLDNLTSGHQSIPIDQFAGQSGEVIFYIAGPEDTPAVFRLDNLAIVGSATLTVLKPNGGKTWTIGKTKAIRWTSASVSGDVTILLSRNGGTTWQTLFADTSNDGTQTWKVKGKVTTRARIRVQSLADSAVAGSSDGNFTIKGLTVLSPNNGEIWAIGSTQTIRWKSAAVGGKVQIELSRDNGVNWTTIVANTANDGTEDWNVAGPVTTQARIRVVKVTNPTIQDGSNKPFTIQ